MASFAQWLEHQPLDQRVTESIPDSQSRAFTWIAGSPAQ